MTTKEAQIALANLKRYISGGGAIDRVTNKAIDMAIKALEKPEPHWIPVTERLPEEYCECLVTYITVDMQEFMDILEYEPSYEFDYEKGRFKGEWLFATDDERFTDSEVIAWMPLPEHYKEVTT